MASKPQLTTTYQKHFLLGHEMRIFGVVWPVGEIKGELMLGPSVAQGISLPVTARAATFIFRDGIQEDGAVAHGNRRAAV